MPPTRWGSAALAFREIRSSTPYGDHPDKSHNDAQGAVALRPHHRMRHRLHQDFRCRRTDDSFRSYMLQERRPVITPGLTPPPRPGPTRNSLAAFAAKLLPIFFNQGSAPLAAGNIRALKGGINPRRCEIEIYAVRPRRQLICDVISTEELSPSVYWPVSVSEMRHHPLCGRSSKIYLSRLWRS